jgi:hypothetical protein
VNTLRNNRQSLIGLALLSLSLAGQAVAAEGKLPPPDECPQPRFTDKAPSEYLDRTNSLTVDAETLAAAESLYTGKSKSLACAICHGVRGDGKGALATQYGPPPRNFACKETVNGIPGRAALLDRSLWVAGHHNAAVPEPYRSADLAIGCLPQKARAAVANAVDPC